MVLNSTKRSSLDGCLLKLVRGCLIAGTFALSVLFFLFSFQTALPVLTSRLSRRLSCVIRISSKCFLRVGDLCVKCLHFLLLLGGQLFPFLLPVEQIVS